MLSLSIGAVRLSFNYRVGASSSCRRHEGDEMMVKG